MLPCNNTCRIYFLRLLFLVASLQLRPFFCVFTISCQTLHHILLNPLPRLAVFGSASAPGDRLGCRLLQGTSFSLDFRKLAGQQGSRVVSKQTKRAFQGCLLAPLHRCTAAPPSSLWLIDRTATRSLPRACGSTHSGIAAIQAGHA